MTTFCLVTFYRNLTHLKALYEIYTSTLNMLFRIQIRYDNVYRNSNSFVMFYLFWLLSKIGHFQVCWLIQDVIGSRAQVKWLAVIVSLENDIFGIAYTSTVRLTQSNSNRYLVKFLSTENFIRRCHHKNVSCPDGGSTFFWETKDQNIFWICYC